MKTRVTALVIFSLSLGSGCSSILQNDPILRIKSYDIEMAARPYESLLSGERGKMYNRILKEIAKIDDPKLLVQIALDVSFSPTTRTAASRSIKDQELLVKVAKEANSILVRTGAVGRITDQKLLGEIANRDNDRFVIKEALSRISDKDVLEDLFINASDESVRIASSVKLKKTSWSDEIDFARLSSDKVAIVLRALSYVDHQSNIALAVVVLCRSYINQGDDRLISVLVTMLNTYGNKDLAEDYLNCGHPALSSAATSWARINGFNIQAGSGSNRARWGATRNR